MRPARGTRAAHAKAVAAATMGLAQSGVASGAHCWAIELRTRWTTDWSRRPRAEAATNGASEARVDGLALEGQNGEDAFVDAAEGLFADESIETLEAEGELARCQRSFDRQAA